MLKLHFVLCAMAQAWDYTFMRVRAALLRGFCRDPHQLKSTEATADKV